MVSFNKKYKFILLTIRIIQYIQLHALNVFSPFCHNCTLKLLKNYDNVVIENKITKLKCPSCNAHKIVLDILFEK